MTQVIEYLPSKALSSNSSTTTKKKIISLIFKEIRIKRGILAMVSIDNSFKEFNYKRRIFQAAPDKESSIEADFDSSFVHAWSRVWHTMRISKYQMSGYMRK
jgi:hypothetical protein